MTLLGWKLVNGDTVTSSEIDSQTDNPTDSNVDSQSDDHSDSESGSQTNTAPQDSDSVDFTDSDTTLIIDTPSDVYVDSDTCQGNDCGCPPGLIGDNCDRSLIFVNANVLDATGHNGTSWENAFNDLQFALAVAANTPSAEIWVAKGTYIPGAERSSTFQLLENVTLFGGFDGTETEREQRIPTENKTILSGLIANDQGSNSVCHVVTGSNNSRLDGFTVTSGNTLWLPGSNCPIDDGAGLLNNEVSPTIANCIFSNNRNPTGSGGAIYNKNSTLSISNCSFVSNVSEDGGAIANDNSVVTIKYCTFLNNESTSGSSISNDISTIITITDSIFQANKGSYAVMGGSSLYVSHSRFLENDGGAIAGGKDSVYSNSLFVSNTAPIGGTFSGGTNIVVANCTILNSKSTSPNTYGGVCNAINTSGNSSYSIVNSIIWYDALFPDQSCFLKNLKISYSMVRQPGCGAGTSICSDTIQSGDPKFVDPTKGNYRLKEDSPCIDAGSNEYNIADITDIDGNGDTTEIVPWDLDKNPRLHKINVLGTNSVDMGAFEYQGQ